MIHKGSHRAADPGALLAGLNPSAKRLGEIYCCAASLARDSGEIRAPCGRGRVETVGARERLAALAPSRQALYLFAGILISRLRHPVAYSIKDPETDRIIRALAKPKLDT